MQSDAAVDIRALQVDRGTRTVLSDFDLTIERGSITGLLGPSGCGKTTLIRSIVGSQQIASGTVRVLGEPAGTATNRARVAYVPQAGSVYTDLTVRQNLDHMAAVVGSDATAVRQALTDVDLSDRSADLVGELSGGQRTRVALAGALLARPDLYLLDEPTVGLDPVLRRDLWALFVDLARAGATLLVSSHVIDEADRCDQVLLMRDGAIVSHGSPARLREQAATDDLEEAFLTLAERHAT